MLKLLSKILWDTGYLQSLKVFPQKMPISYKEKNWFFSGKTWRTPHQVTENYITSNETIVRTFRYCTLIHLCSSCSTAQSCSTLCNPMDCVAPPGSSVYGIFQARILQRVAISYSRGSSQLEIKSASRALAGEFFTTEPPAKLSTV